MKVKSRKYVSIFFILIFIFLSVVYRCYLYKQGNNDETAKKTKSGKTIVEVCLKDDADTYTRKFQIAKYNKENKDNINIVYTTYGEDYSNILKTNLANTNTIDIMQYGYPDLLRSNQVMTLDKLGINYKKYNEDNVFYYNGKRLGMKVSGNSVKLIWNKDILKKAGLNPDDTPKNWDEIIEYCRKIKAAFPDITPIEIPLSTYTELTAAIGTPSVNSDSIYTTFWNYKTGKYDFSAGKDILKKYQELYKEKLMEANLNNSTTYNVRNDFYSGKAAMAISTYADKIYYVNSLPLEFGLGIADVPQTSTKINNKYYYVGTKDILLVNKKTKNLKATKKVYEWLLSQSVNKELLDTGRMLPTTIDKSVKSQNSFYSGYDDRSNYSQEVFDPTLFINYDKAGDENLLKSAINGGKSVDTVIDDLNASFEKYCNITKQQVNFDFSKYTEK